MPSRPPIIEWSTPEERGIEVSAPGLIASFGGGIVVAAMKTGADGSWQVTWSVTIREHRTLPEVELFVAKVASYIVDEPIESWAEFVERAGDDDDVPTA